MERHPSAIHLLAILLFSGLTSGCQSQEEGMRVVCQTPVDCPECMQGLLVLGDNSLLQQHFDRRLRNEDVREVLAGVADAPADVRIKVIRAAAEQLGISDCPFADELAKPITVLAE